MLTRKLPDLIRGAISPYDNYCDGYGNLGSSGNNYMLGFVVSVGKAKKTFHHAGSQMLDEINAFDKAEIEGPYLGQINMSIVSSFCGLQGIIWGYDICRHSALDQKRNKIMTVSHMGQKLEVKSLHPLIDATQELFGKVDKRFFPLIPGAHVPCASKNIKVDGPGRVYAAVAIGIAANREKDACLLMEDVGILREVEESEVKDYELMIIEKIAKSVIEIGSNQRAKYKEILVGIRSVFAEEGDIACGLVAAPYFTLAKNALIDNDVEKMGKSNLNEWIKFRNRK